MSASTDKDDRSNAGPAASVAAPGRGVPLVDNRIDSHDLFVGTREITIAHGPEVYRLRLTAQNKLILTK